MRAGPPESPRPRTARAGRIAAVRDSLDSAAAVDLEGRLSGPVRRHSNNSCLVYAVVAAAL
ncbi:hypothetical protein GCM10009830_12370 [Glycomyces endophyticus]|uniref:Uncharacterized protein n=1 Tax=Glycomyces endophyticus TaxID=480996 RepID=A0ABP4S6M0_9ACTN